MLADSCDATLCMQACGHGCIQHRQRLAVVMRPADRLFLSLKSRCSCCWSTLCHHTLCATPGKFCLDCSHQDCLCDIFRVPCGWVPGKCVVLHPGSLWKDCQVCIQCDLPLVYQFGQLMHLLCLSDCWFPSFGHAGTCWQHPG